MTSEEQKSLNSSIVPNQKALQQAAPNPDLRNLGFYSDIITRLIYRYSPRDKYIYLFIFHPQPYTYLLHFKKEESKTLIIHVYINIHISTAATCRRHSSPTTHNHPVLHSVQMDAASCLCTFLIHPYSSPSSPQESLLLTPIRPTATHPLTPSPPSNHLLTPSSKRTTSHHITNSTHHQFAQELLSTFSLSLGEVALQPSTGGTFIVTIHHLSTSPASASSSTSPASVQSTTLWDRKTDGGFPETKELKRRVRDVIDPSRDLGHVDRHHGAAAAAPAAEAVPAKETVSATEQPAKQEQAPSQTSSTIVCEDCT